MSGSFFFSRNNNEEKMDLDLPKEAITMEGGRKVSSHARS